MCDKKHNMSLITNTGYLNKVILLFCIHFNCDMNINILWKELYTIKIVLYFYLLIIILLTDMFVHTVM